MRMQDADREREQEESMSEEVRKPGRKASTQRNSGHEDMSGHDASTRVLA